MLITLTETPFQTVRGEIVSNLGSYPSPVDSYFEDHVVESEHYSISVDGVPCGFASIFSKTMMTQFALDAGHLHLAGDVFDEVLNTTRISEAYVPTSDNLLLIMVLDHHQAIEVQDCVFVPGLTRECNQGFYIRKAEIQDAGMVAEKHDGFFPSIEEKISREELFIGYDGDRVVSFGVIENSVLLEKRASIGMVVVPESRGNGYGAMTITKLIDQCRQTEISPVAGCFAKNLYSRNALTKAGMVSTTRLLKVKL